MKQTPETVYRGLRTPDGVVVTRDGEPLSPAPSQTIWNHSPDGFEWGYGGSGPAQLALGLLLDATGDERLAERLHNFFLRRVVVGFDKDEWQITAREIFEVIGRDNGS